MRWEAVKITPENELYRLWHEGKQILSLTFHPFSQTARVESSGEKRVFLIRKEGFLRNKTIIRNEYGVKVGEIGQENKTQYIDVNEERFFYTIENNPHSQLVLYKDSIDNPLTVCDMDLDGENTIHFDKNRNLISHYALLTAVCWYMFQPVALEYAL
jgi:hypothetical protein